MSEVKKQQKCGVSNRRLRVPNAGRFAAVKVGRFRPCWFGATAFLLAVENLGTVGDRFEYPTRARPTREVDALSLKATTLTVIGWLGTINFFAGVKDLTVVAGDYGLAVARSRVSLAVDMLAELAVEAVVVDPRRDRPLARGEYNSSNRFTPSRSVFVVGTRTTPFVAIDAVLAAVLADHGEYVASLVEHSHVLGSVVGFGTTVGFLSWHYVC